MSTDDLFGDDDSTELPFEEWDTPDESRIADAPADGTESQSSESATAKAGESQVGRSKDDDGVPMDPGSESETAELPAADDAADIPFETWDPPSRTDDDSRISKVVSEWSLPRPGTLSGGLSGLVEEANVPFSSLFGGRERLSRIAAAAETVLPYPSGNEGRTPPVSRRAVLKVGAFTAGSIAVGSVLTSKQGSKQQEGAAERIPAFGYGGRQVTDESSAGGAVTPTEPVTSSTAAIGGIGTATGSGDTADSAPRGIVRGPSAQLPSVTTTEASQSSSSRTATPTPESRAETSEATLVGTTTSAPEPVPAGGNSGGGSGSSSGDGGGGSSTSGPDGTTAASAEMTPSETTTAAEATARLTAEAMSPTDESAVDIGEQGYGEQGYGGVVVE